MHRVQEILSDGENVNQVDQHQAAMSTLKEKRLTFAWVDSEAQKVYICCRLKLTNITQILIFIHIHIHLFL